MATTVLLATVVTTGCAADPRARTTGTLLDDQVIEMMVRRDILRSDPGFDSAHLVAVSYNGVLLLAGQVASDELKRLATTRAKAVNKVRSVHNELEIGAPISLVARANDSWLTTKIKTKMLQDDEIVAGKIKVVTENGVVFLMGLLPVDEADRAVEIARSVYGVQKIVKVFEYI